MKLLHIDSSILGDNSASRQLSQAVVQSFAGADVTYRDLATDALTHFSSATLAGGEVEAKLSADTLSEFLAADVVVIGAPMYNFSITSTLKTWIDHVARAGVTFKYTETGPVGLIQGKKVYVFTSRGGVYSEGPAKVMDFHETYLRAVLGFIGMTDVTFVHSEGLGMGEAAVEKAIAQTRETIGTLVAA